MVNPEWLNSAILIFGTGFGIKLIDWGYARWRDAQVAKGRRESEVQRWRIIATTWEGIAHRCRTIALKNGVSEETLDLLFRDAPNTFDE